MNEDPFTDLPGGEQQAFRIAYLVAGFIRHTLSRKEMDELDEWVNASLENELLFEKLIDRDNNTKWLEKYRSVDTEGALARIKQKISFAPGRTVSRVRSLWVYATAACVLLAIMIGFLALPSKKPTPEPTIVQTKPADILPGTNQATLTLANGNLIALGSQISQQLPESNVRADTGVLTYPFLETTLLPQANTYNTLATPAGGQFKVTLPDGTRVWLNASSSLTYPVVFGNGKRVVQLKGEGYFEVAKDPAHPFEVQAAGSTVQVLGTHFNVNAYTDEPVLKVVLAEGSVKLNNSLVLKPGEGAAVDGEGRMKASKADLETVLAWKEGLFVFKEASMETLMRQVQRWYNVKIIYAAQIREHFNAAIPRNLPVSQLLHLLEATGAVHFKIADQSITVMK